MEEQKKTFEELPLKERIIITTSTSLIKHFRGLEMAGVISKEVTAKQIGRVKKLTSIAKGEEVKETKTV